MQGKKKIKMARVRLRTPRQKSGEPVRSATESPRLVTRHGPPGRGRVQGPRHSALFVGISRGTDTGKGGRDSWTALLPATRTAFQLRVPTLPSEKLSLQQSLQHSAGHRNSRRSGRQSAGEPAPERPRKN